MSTQTLRPTAVIVLLVVSTLIVGAAPTPQQTLEAAAIHESRTLEGGGRLAFTPGRLSVVNVPLSMIIEFAYRLPPRGYQLVNAPEWAGSTRFNIDAVYTGTATADEEWGMLRRLLEDRFSLRTHRDTRDVTAYALTVSRSDGRLGPNFVRSDVDCDKWRAEKRPSLGAGPPSRAAPGFVLPQCSMLANPPMILGGAIPMSDLVTGLSFAVRAPVIDRTGLAGLFDVDLKYAPASTDLPAPSSDAVYLFTAVQEQLGLRLERDKGTLDVLVVDTIAHPSPN